LDSDYCNGGFIHLFNGNSCYNILTPEQFDEWGWRVPFWLSIVMVGVSYLIRKTWMNHLFSPKLKAKENKYKSFERKFWKSLQYEICIIALFGATMGQGVVWYTGQFCNEFHENSNVH
jgi:MFS family permease